MLEVQCSGGINNIAKQANSRENGASEMEFSSCNSGKDAQHYYISFLAIPNILQRSSILSLKLPHSMEASLYYRKMLSYVTSFEEVDESADRCYSCSQEVVGLDDH